MQSNMTYKYIYETYSLALAAALESANVGEVTKIEFNKTNKATLTVSHNLPEKRLEFNISQFWKNQYMIDASTYYNNLKNLKARIFELRQNYDR